MHPKALKVFCDVVGYRSFSVAAAENGMTQPGVSQIVHQLEEHLGVRLIDRSKRPFVLTPEGDVYYESCRKLIQRYHALEEEVRTLHQGVAGRVAVASIYSVGLSYREEVFDRFAARHPHATMHVEYHHPDGVYALVEQDRVDLGLVSYAQTTRTIRAIDWRREPMVLVCAPGHRLAARSSIALDELQGLEMIGFDRELKNRRHIDRELAERGIEVHVGCAFDNIDTIKRAVVVNVGCSFLPEPAVRGELESGELVAVRVEGLRLDRPLGIISRRGGELGKTARRFLQFLLEECVPEPVEASAETAAEPLLQAAVNAREADD